MEKLLEEEHLSQYSCRTPHWTPGSSCRPAGTGTRQRHMRLFLQQGPGQVGCRGSLMREAPSWMLCVEPAVNTDPLFCEGHWPLPRAQLRVGTKWGRDNICSGTPATASQNGYQGQHPSLLAALPTSCLEAVLTVTAGKPEPRPHTGTVSSLPGHLEPAQLSPTLCLPPTPLQQPGTSLIVPQAHLSHPWRSLFSGLSKWLMWSCQSTLQQPAPTLSTKRPLSLLVYH